MSKTKTTWHKYPDEKPEDASVRLVTVRRSFGSLSVDCARYSCTDDGWYTCNEKGRKVSAYYKNDIIAWTDMPEPYSSENEKKSVEYEYPGLDVRKVFSNLKILTKIKGVKIKDLEKQANLSTGYISRISCTESHNSLSKYLNLFVTAANMMHVSFEDLFFKDYETEKRKRQEQILDTLGKMSSLSKDDLKLIIETLEELSKDKQDE